MGKLILLKELLRHFGPVWLLRRAVYAAKVRCGWLEWSNPRGVWSDSGLAGCVDDPDLADLQRYSDYRKGRANRFFFQADQFPDFQPFFERWDDPDHSPVRDAERILKGELCFFGHDWAETGFPPAWQRNPFTGRERAADSHWSRLGDFDFGDIKVLWEPSRFAFVFPLVRAYARTGDERFAESFWIAVQDWRVNNLPQCGVNWKCGQEASFRLMAWCFALHAFLQSPASTPGRLAMLAEMLAVHGRRIEANIGYGLSQNNNHGISEAVGLWTLGVIFPEFREATRWRNMGARLLASQVDELVYDDGSFSQHSVNYHRVMLHDCIWAIRVGEAADEKLPGWLVERVGRAGRWMSGMILGNEGQAPNYGANDGAQVFPLTNCGYDDYRPVAQAAACCISREPAPFQTGPWDEEALWFGGVESLKNSLRSGAGESPELSARSGGYYTMKGGSSAAMIRCPGRFKHRPGQADLLHVDLWWRGENVAVDSGTFSYNATAPWANGLVHTAVHNTVAVAGRDQADPVGRFLLLPWPRGRVNSRRTSNGGRLAYWEGEHDGYARLKPPVRHCRALARLGDECWVVLDNIATSGRHGWEVNWLFPDVPITRCSENSITFQMKGGEFMAQFQALSGNPTADLARAAADSTRGWRSRFYLDKEPAVSWRISFPGGSGSVVTVFGPGDLKVDVSADRIEVFGADWSAVVNLHQDSSTGRLLADSMLFRSADEEREYLVMNT